jgi:type I restriction enzyme M protein
VIANVFRGVQNRMISGYLLRDVVNLIDGIHFNAADEMHTLGHLYESMLREMRDTAGDSGEFYTPRPVVRFMVEVTDPRLGEVVLDPACGTGGFLSESFGHLEKQCKTVEDMKRLQEKSIFGGEAKPLPYMLAQMNLLLHGLKSPQIAYGNSLAGKLLEIGKRDRVDVVLTNPPFGGEEEAGIRTNFPTHKQTSETALLFLQHIMRKLRRPGENPGGRGNQLPSPSGRGAGGEGGARASGKGAGNRLPSPTRKGAGNQLPSPSGRGAGHQLPSPSGRGAGGEGIPPFGRAAVVVPNGTLFGDGVCARIKHELLTEFNLHTIVRLPNGVFAPYTSIPTNLLFFDCSAPTKTIWYYEQPLPEERKNYTKTKPIQYEEFADCLKWWGKRKENGRAWKVKASDVIKLDDDGNLVSVNLDIKNPSAEEALEHLPPEQLVESILTKEKRIIEIMGEIKKVLAGAGK